MTLDRRGMIGALERLGQLLADRGEHVRVVVVGGAALSLLRVVDRTTRDVDVIAFATETSGELTLARPPELLPPALTDGIARVARDLGLEPDWMNCMVSRQWATGMPPQFDRGITWLHFGGLHVGLAGRFALICLKTYASADHGPGSRHTQDLTALRPSPAELAEAAQWIATQDPTIGPIVDKVIAHVVARLQ